MAALELERDALGAAGKPGGAHLELDAEPREKLGEEPALALACESREGLCEANESEERARKRARNEE